MTEFHNLEELQHQLETMDANSVLSWALNNFSSDDIVFATSLQIEGQAVCDIALRLFPDIQIVTIDTGKLNKEVIETLRNTERKYNIHINIIQPDQTAVEKMIHERGGNLFRNSIQDRQYCCYTRKVQPLKKVLIRKKAWITGLRRGQSQNRKSTKKIEWDSEFNLIKINPIADWSLHDVWKYIKENNIPYCSLYDQGYTSIGCKPCTRPSSGPHNIRSGRWWWEKDSSKECGLHGE